MKCCDCSRFSQPTKLENTGPRYESKKSTLFPQSWQCWLPLSHLCIIISKGKYTFMSLMRLLRQGKPARVVPCNPLVPLPSSPCLNPGY